MVNYFVHLRVIQRMADLACDILQVPYRKTVFAGESGGDGIALYIFGSCQQLPVFIAHAVQNSNVVAVQRLRPIGFFKNRFDQVITVGQVIECDYFQRKCLLSFRVLRLVHGGK